MQDNRARAAELTQQLRDQAKAQDPIARAAIELIRLHGEMQKDSLVDAVGDDMLRAQGAARQLKKLHTDLTKAPANIQEPSA